MEHPPNTTTTKFFKPYWHVVIWVSLLASLLNCLNLRGVNKKNKKPNE